jgi:phosphoserine aminotransferase
MKEDATNQHIETKL